MGCHVKKSFGGPEAVLAYSQTAPVIRSPRRP